MIIGEFNDTYPPELDGVGTVVKSYAEELTAMGDECYYVAPNCPKYARIPMYRTLLFHGVKLPGEPYHFGFPSLDFAYLRRENRVPFDIVHAHSPFSAGREALRVARKRGVPIVATFHSKYYDDFYEKTRSRRIASLAASYVVNFYNHCDEVWAVNDRTADVLRGYGYQGDVVVMPNGTNLCRVDERAAAEARAQFSPDGAPIFLFVGQMNWKKNIRRVLEAVALYSREAPCRLVMVGQGPNEEDIQKACEELGVAERTIRTGHIADRDRLMAIYAAASLLIFPSVYDNAPMVVREAAAVGTPSILMRGSCAAEGVTDGVNGLLCEDTAESVCDCMRRGLSNRGALGQAARATIPQPWRKIVADARTRYEALVLRNLEKKQG